MDFGSFIKIAYSSWGFGRFTNLRLFQIFQSEDNNYCLKNNFTTIYKYIYDETYQCLKRSWITIVDFRWWFCTLSSYRIDRHRRPPVVWLEYWTQRFPWRVDSTPELWSEVRYRWRSSLPRKPIHKKEIEYLCIYIVIYVVIIFG